MPNSTSIKSIAAAIADELQLDDAERVSVSQVTVSITYQVDHSTDPTDCHPDWMDEWYRQYTDRELVPF